MHHPPVAKIPQSSAAGRQARIAALRRKIHALETPPPRWGRVAMGAPEADAQAFDGGLARGALYAVEPQRYGDAPAAAGFALALAARALATHPGPLVWVSAPAAFDAGAPYGPGLAAFGVDPGRMLFVRAPDRAASLAVMEEAAGAPGVAAALCWADARVDAAAARRVHLAAEKAGGFALIWRARDAAATVGVRAAWRVTAAASAPPAWAEAAGLAARATPPGAPTWRVERVRGRGGAAVWTLAWRPLAGGGSGTSHHEAYGFHLVEPLAERSPAAWGSGLREAG